MMTTPKKEVTAREPQDNEEKKWYKDTATGRAVFAASYAEAIELLSTNEEKK